MGTCQDLLGFLGSKNIPLILIGKGGEDMHEEIERLGLRKFFKKIIFAQGDKDPQAFKQYIPQNKPKSTLVVGDRVRSELEIGNKLGATTVWLKQGKFASEAPQNPDQEPDHVVASLSQLKDLLLSLDQTIA